MNLSISKETHQLMSLNFQTCAVPFDLELKNYLHKNTLLRKLTLFLVFIMMGMSVQAQIGIGTVSPDTLAILDIQSTKKGILLPRVDKLETVNKVLSSILYDKNTGKFKYFDGTQWLSVNPLNPDVADNVTAPKDLTVSGNATINGTSLNMPNATSLNAPNAVITGYGTIPIGGIIMWSGTGEPGEGWALCNGQWKNGIKTPNLSNSFIVASDSTGLNVKFQGGNDSIKLEPKHLPKHNHAAGQLTATTAGNHQHEHKGFRKVDDGTGEKVQSNKYISTDPLEYGGELAGDHTHPITGVTAYTGGVYYPERFHLEGGSPDQYLPKSSCTAYQQCISSCKDDPSCISNCDNYVYTNSCRNPDYNPNYGKKVIESEERWDVHSINIRPKYFVLAFIMRVK